MTEKERINAFYNLTEEALIKIAQEIDVQYGPAMRMLAAGEESVVKEIESECVSEEDREQ